MTTEVKLVHIIQILENKIIYLFLFVIALMFDFLKNITFSKSCSLNVFSYMKRKFSSKYIVH